MALDMVIDQTTFEALPEVVQAEYNERDGQYQLDVVGSFSEIDRNKLKTSLDAERAEHRQTKQRFAGLEGVTREQVEKIWDTAAERGIQLEEAQGQGDLEERASRLAESRVTQQVRPLERQIVTLTEERDAAVTELTGMKTEAANRALVGEVAGAFQAKGIGGLDDALPDVELWAPTAFERLEDNSLVSRENVPGVKPGLSPEEVFKDFQSNGVRSHWFAGSKGAGARGGKGDPIDTSNNPFKSNDRGGVVDLTKASALIKQDRAAAKRLADIAGTTHLFPTSFGKS